jgi:hypothetical protein
MAKSNPYQAQADAQDRLAAKQWLLSLPPKDFATTYGGLNEAWAMNDPDLRARYMQTNPSPQGALNPNAVGQGPWSPRRGGPRQPTAQITPEATSFASLDAGLDGGGGGGTTGGGGGAAPVDMSGYLALLRALQLEEDQYTQDAAQTRDKVDRSYQQRLPEIQRSADRSQRRVNTDFLGRGLFRSGARLRDLGEVDEERGRQVTQAETGRNDALSAVEQELARRRSNIETRRTEAGLNYGVAP